MSFFGLIGAPCNGRASHDTVRKRLNRESSMSSFQASMFPRGVVIAASALLRTAMAVAGVFMVIALMFFALTFASLVVLWALVRGRRPQPVRFAWQGFRRPGAFRSAADGQRQAQGEVVDVEAREVTPWQQR